VTSKGSKLLQDFDGIYKAATKSKGIEAPWKTSTTVAVKSPRAKGSKPPKDFD
jgi:hypothetical protein